jgi:hypothetical protein
VPLASASGLDGAKSDDGFHQIGGHLPLAPRVRTSSDSRRLGWCSAGSKVLREEPGELGDGRPYVLLFVVKVVMAGAVDPVEFLGAGGVLEGVDTHPGRDGRAAGDHEQGSLPDQAHEPKASKNAMWSMLDALGDTLAAHHGTAGILRDQAPPPLDGWAGVDAVVVSTENVLS